MIKELILRKSKFFGYSYADEIAELSFYAQNFSVKVENDVLKISFELMKGLDFDQVNQYLSQLSFFEIQDQYLKHKLLKTLNEIPQIKKIQFFKIDHYYNVKKLKFTLNGFLLSLT